LNNRWYTSSSSGYWSLVQRVTGPNPDPDPNRGCVLFQNLTNLDRSERNALRSQSKLIWSDTAEKIWLSHAHLCCMAAA